MGYEMQAGRSGSGKPRAALVILRQPAAPWETPGMPRGSEDLGIAYLASSLERAGQPYIILDQGLTRFDDEEFLERILHENPHLIGYSDNCDQLGRIIRTALAVRRRLPGVYQVIGDHGASFHADELLGSDTGFDAVCIGEGEHTLVELLQRLENGKPPEGIPGLLTRIGGRAKFLPRQRIANPSELAWPNRYVLSTRDSQSNETLSCTILGSRGCPYRCSFCGNDLYQDLSPGASWRPREASELVDEMEFLHQRYGVDSFTFLDELFVGSPSGKNRERLFQFCKEIRRRGLRITFRVTCRADFFEPLEDRELVLALREAGLDKVFFGIENGYPATIKLYNKGSK
ncbi:MAG: radical SAM protein, partial [Syntrophobacteraceae bacterium]